MGLLPASIRLVFFDAVGTLLRPVPSVAEAYHQVGCRYGSTRPVDALRKAFYAAFARQEAFDAQNGYRTNAARERERWRAIVTEVLPDVSDAEGCFAALWDHFADPAHWQLEPATADLLAALGRQGISVGLASNFDDRLIPIVQAQPVLMDHLDAVVVSSQIGWRKPAREFYAALCEGYAPHEVLMIGDDRVNDYEGARAAGLHAFLLDEQTTLCDLLAP
jgi:putative hydrolase of the HAD superfamily